MKLCTLFCLSILMSGVGTLAYSQIVVSNTNDAGPGSLRQAINDANSGGVIQFAPGLSGQKIRLTTGALIVDKSLTIDGAGLATLIAISGDADASDSATAGDSRVFEVSAGISLVLEALRITRGAAPVGINDGDGGNGGGILNLGNLTVRRSVVELNSAGKGNGTGSGGQGGAIWSSGSLTLELSSITGNASGDGGFGGNDSGGNGGGVYNAGTLEIDSSTFGNNTAGAGGNDGVGGYGGGLFHDSGNGVVRKSTFSGNKAGSGGLGGGSGSGGFGGGICNHAPLEVINTTLVGNEAGEGDAGGAFTGTGGNGGGIFNQASLTLKHLTVVGNKAGDGTDFGGNGGGIATDLAAGVVTLTNCLVAQNTSSGGGPDLFKNGFSAINRAGVNLIGNNQSVATVFPTPSPLNQPNTNGDLVGTSASPINPLLTPLGSFGGPTQTRTPLPTSRAIDPPGGRMTSDLTTDQRGGSRVRDGDAVQGLVVDIGAVEYDKDVDGGAGTLGFAQNPSSILEGSGTGLVGVTRVGGSRGVVTVRVDSSNTGTATSSDYNAVTNFVLTFNHGEVLKFVPVTILPDPTVRELNETFSMILSAPTGGAVLGNPTIGTVRIVDAFDSVSPGLTLLTPINNQLSIEGNGPVFNIKGTASDNQGIERVEMSLDGAAYQAIGITLASDFRTATFDVPVTVNPGIHTILVRALDTRARSSAVVRRVFTYKVEQPLAVAVNDLNLGGVSTGFVPTSIRNLGFLYSITAVPKAGSVFDGWTVSQMAGAGVTAASAELPKLNFLMQPGLSLTANFRLNPFVSALIGSFEGLVLPDVGQTPGVETVGHLTATVSSKGGVTGRLRVDGSNLSYVGTLDNSGFARFGTTRSKILTIKRQGKADLELELNLDMTGASKQVSGTLTRKSNGTTLTVSKIAANRAHYSKALKADASLAGAVSQRYNLILPAKAQVPALATNLYPQGAGIGSLVVKPDGTVSCGLTLADNTVMPTWAAKLTEANTLVVFGALYSSKGCFAAEVKLDPTQAATDAEGLDALWCRPAIATSQWYPAGWPAGLNVDVFGSKLSVVTESSVVPALGAEDLANGNVDLTFVGGLTPGIAKLVSVSVADKVTRVPATDASFTAAITRTTGGVKGTVVHPATAKAVNWQVILFQKAGVHRGGHGFFLSPLPKPVTGLGESGAVLFKAK